MAVPWSGLGMCRSISPLIALVLMTSQGMAEEIHCPHGLSTDRVPMTTEDGFTGVIPDTWVSMILFDGMVSCFNERDDYLIKETEGQCVLTGTGEIEENASGVATCQFEDGVEGECMVVCG